MSRKQILILSSVLVFVVLLVFVVRWRTKRLIYKGQVLEQEQVASVLKEALASPQFQKLSRMKMEGTDSLEAFSDQTHGDYIHQEFHKLYEKNNYQLVWLELEGPKEGVSELLEAIGQAKSDGLDPRVYSLIEIQGSLDSIFPTEYYDVDFVELLEADFMISSAALRYACHLRFGMIDPTKATFWKTYSGSSGLSLSEYILDAIKTESIKEGYENLIPKNRYYATLKEAYNNYRMPEKQVFVQPSDLSVGDSSAAISQLRKRLIMDGYPLDTASTIFDERLEKVIMDVQDRYGIEPSGKMNSKTAEALNVPFDERYHQIKINLERARWLPENTDYLLVNIPEFKLRIYKEGKKDLEMRVIVGKEYTSTPVFGDTIEHIIFSPTWGVPNSIASKEMLPNIRRNPGYLTRNNYKVYRNGRSVDPGSVDWNSVSQDNFNYQIVQSPGSGNALGHVKFMFPNPMNIYLHDTPTGHLFQKNERTFSHGCIRVEKPDSLALYLLAETGKYDRIEDIHSEFGKSSPKKVDLPEKLPVQIFYLTAWVDDNGRLNFREDVYGHDKRHGEQMNQLSV